MDQLSKCIVVAGLGIVVASVATAVRQSPAAEAPAMFPFVLPWSDSTPGTATDVSFLNTLPAGANGPIVSRGGHFVETNTGKRIRFLGTNFAARAAFPSHEDAEKVAARIAKLGINLVRMHHMDNVDWGQTDSIWDYSYKDRQHISVAQLDRLDYLISQLKKHGVYVNLNLHVSRQFSTADGFPKSIGEIKFGYDKRVDEFDARMIQLQKQYARDLLTHVNPYTGLAYAADPAIAMVEINNENSLVGDPWANYGADLEGLPEPFRGELTALWNEWLARKYSTDSALQSAWTTGVTPAGPGLLTASSTWSDEHQGSSDASMTVETAGSGRFAAPVHVEIRKIDGTDWHVQVHETGLDLAEGATYTVSFRAKADTPREVPVNCGLDEADWHNIGLAASAKLSTEWHAYHYSFTARNVIANHGRIAFVLGGLPGSVWLSDVQIHAGAEGAGIQSGESLERKNIEIPVSALRAQHDDWIVFLADAERRYALDMRRYIKEDLHSSANVICSQIPWGGLTGIRREGSMDFADNHAYWQHPSFPHKPWDPEDWSIENTPMVTDLAEGKAGIMMGLAEFRVADKPYTVSEYNHPAPNEYRAETLPELATFAALQDWDAIYLFDYGNYGTGVDNDKINGYFGISSDPAKTAFLPSAAMIFRASEIPAARPVSLDVSEASLNVASGSLWPAMTPAALLSQALSIRVSSDRNRRSGISETGTRMARPLTSKLEKRGGKALYTCASPSALCAVGYLGGETIDLPGATIAIPKFGNGFAALTLTTMDGAPLATSARLLLTLVGKVENQGMIWNAQRTSVGSNWGHGPTGAEGVPATITLAASGSLAVWALDGTGKRVTKLPARNENGRLVFTVGPQYRTLWYELSH